MALEQYTSMNLIGDPTVSGWVITVAYFFSVVLCIQKYKQQKMLAQPIMFWLGLGLLLLFLGLNKQLDLQTFFLVTMKDIVKSLGLYEQRQLMQIGFIMFLIVSVITTFLIARVALVDSWINYRWVWYVLLLLFCFIIFRATTFTQLSYLKEQMLLGFSLHSLIELFIVTSLIVSIYFNNSHNKKYVNVVENEHAFCPNCRRLGLMNVIEDKALTCIHCSYSYTVIVSTPETIA